MTTINDRPAPEVAPREDPTLDVTILLPCRNEEQTVGLCTTTALGWLTSRDLRGEVLVVDNGSTDASAAHAAAAGARVIHEQRVGYGAAIRAGLRAARGAVIIMADADNTYDLTNLDAFYDPIALAATHDIVVGNRLTSLDSGAMNWLHRVGNRMLSALTRAASGSQVRDMHCGLRSFSNTAMVDLPAWSTGMEFATHMLTHAHHRDLRSAQTPIHLRPPVSGRKSHLRPFRDGLRHLAAILRETRMRGAPR